MDWTIDTQVLYKAAGTDMEAIRLLADIHGKENGVGLDYGGLIRKEYDDCANCTRNRFIRKWIVQVADKLVVMRDGHLSQKHQAELKRLEFDPDDWVFVAVCSKIEGRTLVAEESDYRLAVREYLKAGLGISVLSVTESLARLV